ncbi:MAG: flagellar motor protein MotB [Candidatus Goldbacteria bacterium]|nr:flagellar motor protein MotB [Candidatus Goldiibacteriota bacterium]
MGKKRRDFGIGEGGEMETAGLMRWLLTYADMLTLLFALFVILYSISAVDVEKLRALAMALGNAFGLKGHVSILQTGATTDTKPIIMEQSQIQLTTLKEKVQKWILQQKLEREVKIRFNERGLVISLMTDKILFRSGYADLLPRTQRILSDIAELLKEITNPVIIEGHTDDVPITSPAIKRKYSDNWDLSTARAVNVLKYLIRKGISPDRLSAAGYASYKPLVPNIDDITRAKNRRIDIIVLKADLIEDKEKQSREWPLPSDIKIQQQIEKENIDTITY